MDTALEQKGGWPDGLRRGSGAMNRDKVLRRGHSCPAAPYREPAGAWGGLGRGPSGLKVKISEIGLFLQALGSYWRDRMKFVF